MGRNLFEHYVLGGGWAMFILVPASVVAVATLFRAMMLVSRGAVARLTAEVRATVMAQRSAGRPVSLTDARTVAADGALRLFAAIQPLGFVYSIAPFAGAAGTLWALLGVWQSSAQLSPRYMALALEHAFVPLGWGLVIALFSIASFGLLKSRIISIELEALAPAAIGALDARPERPAGGPAR